jgi:hypothetical protein
MRPDLKVSWYVLSCSVKIANLFAEGVVNKGSKWTQGWKFAMRNDEGGSSHLSMHPAQPCYMR